MPTFRLRHPPCRHAVAVALTVALALILNACGSSAPAGNATSASRSHSSATTAPASTNPSATGTGTGTGTGTSTTPALPGTGKPAVTIGDKNYTEQFILGQLYAQALQAQGYAVNLNQNIGPTDVTVQALNTGALAMYPEYLSTFNTDIAGYRHAFRTAAGAYDAAEHWALGHDLELLDPTPFSDTDAIAVTDAYAAANHLTTIRDLRRVQRSLTLGGPTQFQQGDPPPGLPQLRVAYGFSPAIFKALAIGDQYTDLDTNVVQAADVNTTDGQLASGDYVLLSDPRRVFGWGAVVPVVVAKVLAQEGPAFAETINRVDATLTLPVMRLLNQAVDVSKLSPAAVATQYLQTHGLLTPMAQS